MKRVAIFLLYLVTLLVYTQGFLERFTPIPAKLAIEVCVLFLMLCYFRPKVGIWGMVLILIIGVIASLNTNGILSFIKYIRFFFYFYVLYTVFWRVSFTITEFNHYIRFTIMMVLLQGVASIINIAFFGRAEYNVGAMSSLGGTTATAFPLFIFSVLLVIYYFSSFTRKNWYIYIVLMIASVFLISYSCLKRAIYFYAPPFLLVITIICSLFINRGMFRRKLLGTSIAFVLFIPIFFFGITQAVGISDSLVGNENRIEVLERAIEYAEFYEEAESDGATIGRSNTTDAVMNQAVSSVEGWLFGNGFGAMKDEDEISQAGIGYGFVGYSRDVFSGGILFASLLALFMVFLIFHHSPMQRDSFSRVMRFVLFIVFVVIHFTYSANFTVSLKLNMILAPLLCYLNSENYCHLKHHYSTYLLYEVK